MKRESLGIRLLACFVGVLALIACLPAAGCASDPKPRANLSDKGVTDEGPNRNPSRASAAEASGSTAYPSVSIFLTEGSDGVDAVVDDEGNIIAPAVPAKPAVLSASKPGSTTTGWIGPLDTWVDAAGIIDVLNAKATTADGATFEADSIRIDNKATLEGAALYAQAVGPTVQAMSADQREAFKAWVEANADVLKSTLPDLFGVLRAALGIP